MQPKDQWIQTDFNGILESGLLCLAHTDVVNDVSGREIVLKTGMVVTAFDLDGDENGDPDNIFASGIVEPSPDYARCNGSRWSLRIDSAGIRWESDLSRTSE